VVRELRQDNDTTILLTTHDMFEADELCDRIAIIEGGKIVALGTPQELKRLISRNGHEPTLEDVFLELTGKKLKEKMDAGSSVTVNHRPPTTDDRTAQL
jgi:ABC-2 type transport system ATP-binding protein